MKIKSVSIKDFKRFTDLTISNIPETTKLVVILGPNGCGKSSLFDSFSFYMNGIKHGNNISHEYDYHQKDTCKEILHWTKQKEKIKICFHDTGVSTEIKKDNRKNFYFRTAYRHEPNFGSTSIEQCPEILEDRRDPRTMINIDTRVSDNYKSMASIAFGKLFETGDGNNIKRTELRDFFITKIRNAMQNVFHDLLLEGPGNPLNGGTFLFSKGVSSNFKYKNLSGGEKAAFDLLLDFVVKAEHFNNTVYCIDEPELHMHTKLQGRLLQEIVSLLPDNCQLWIATHSIGMIRKAKEMHRTSPEDVVFLDFSGKDFDQPQTLKPIIPDRKHWQNIFEVPLGDLVDLIAPQHIVFCEGEKIGGNKNKEFDATCFNKIFKISHPDVQFVSVGGCNDVKKNSALLISILKDVLKTTKITPLYDRDDRNTTDIKKIEADGGKVLSLRDIENYIWDDEILRIFCQNEGVDNTKIEKVLSDKQNAIKESVARSNPQDDIKSASNSIYDSLKKTLSLAQCGNERASFAIENLVPLITPDTLVYKKLESDIFGVESSNSIPLSQEKIHLINNSPTGYISSK